MVDHIVLIQRQSPPWAELAQLHRAGLLVEPARYLPEGPIPGFPGEVPRLISAWNEMFRLDYFTCRAVLKEIAGAVNSLAQGAVLLNYTDQQSAASWQANSLLYFYDDDDVFDNNISRILKSLPADGYDVVVSPLFRFNDDLFTFVRDGEMSDLLIGRRQNFHFRYQTNNYGLNGSCMDQKRFAAMKDHVEASAYAEANTLTDRVISRPLSATFKTPWSASLLPVIDQGRGAVVEQLGRFCDRARATRLTREYSWLSAYLENVCIFIDFVQAGGSYVHLEAWRRGIQSNVRRLISSASVPSLSSRHAVIFGAPS